MTLTRLVLATAMAAVAATAHAEAKVGAAAPDFTLPAASDGKSVALKSLLKTNKAVAVLFIAVKCPYSNGYNERMAQLAKDYAAKGIAVVGINSNKTEPAADVAAHAKQHGFSFAVVKDEGNKVADLYGAQHTPEAFVVDAKGTLVYHGRIDENYEDAKKVASPDLRTALDSVVAGTPIKASETKAFGCSIKR